MNKIFSFLFFGIFLFAFLTCRISTEYLAEQVQEGIIEHYKKNNSEIIFIQKLILVHKAGNEYIGGADVSLDGIQCRISINVLSDRKSYNAEWSFKKR